MFMFGARTPAHHLVCCRRKIGSPSQIELRKLKPEWSLNGCRRERSTAAGSDKLSIANTMQCTPMSHDYLVASLRDDEGVEEVTRGGCVEDGHFKQGTYQLRRCLGTA